MIVTEEEAKTKRCQESFGDRILGSGEIVEVEFSADPLHKGVGPSAMHYTSPVYCIGSDCMAWRWSMCPNEVTIDRTERKELTFGYCGKAGRP